MCYCKMYSYKELKIVAKNVVIYGKIEEYEERYGQTLKYFEANGLCIEDYKGDKIFHKNGTVNCYKD